MKMRWIELNYEQRVKMRERDRTMNASDWAIESTNDCVIIIIVIMAMISCFKWGLTFHSFHSFNRPTMARIELLYANWCCHSLSPSRSHWRLLSHAGAFSSHLLVFFCCWNLKQFANLPLHQFRANNYAVKSVGIFLFLHLVHLLKTPDECEMPSLSLLSVSINIQLLLRLPTTQQHRDLMMCSFVAFMFKFGLNCFRIWSCTYQYVTNIHSTGQEQW